MDGKKGIQLGEGLQSMLQEEIHGLEPAPTTSSVDTHSLGNDLSAERPLPDQSEEHTEEHDAGSTVIEDREILYSFIEESRDLLRTVEEKALSMEQEGENGAVDELFRAMHTIKGTASFLGFTHIERLSHAMENLLDRLRTGKLEVSGELTDHLLAGTDTISRALDHIARYADQEAGETGTLLIPPLENLERDTETLLRQMERLADEPEQSPAQRPTPQAASLPGTENLLTPDVLDQFATEAAEILDHIERILLDMEKGSSSPEAVEELFRGIHTLKGNAGFLGMQEIEQTCMHMEEVLERLRSEPHDPSPAVVSALLGSIDTVRGKIGNTVTQGREHEQPAGSGPPEQEEPERPKPLGEILVDMGAAQPEAVEQALELQEKRVGEILLQQGAVSEEKLHEALEKQQEDARRQAAASGGTTVTPRRDIRVDMRKLDRLFNLTGELIAAESMVVHNPEIKAIKIESFERATRYLEKITREMQEITMSVRMVPLEGIFNKMRRLVRDLARKCGKRIELVVSGQETEMDRNVIEEISDPLVHIIRNAVDHGIEPPEQRRRSGKNETGMIWLNARYEGNEIWVSVKNDGAPLDRERILEKARARGLVSQEESHTMPDEKVWSLIFEPGFSTAERITEISGRGVGMDVVKRNIEKLRGKIDIRSDEQATEFILRIPLTLAILDGVIVRVGRSLYTLRQDDILEFHRPHPRSITVTEESREVLRLRDRILPLIKLYEFFGIETETRDAHEGLVIVVQAGSRQAALLVDGIVGYQQVVIKALPRYLRGIRAVSGCTVLGDGTVALILDVGSILDHELER